MPNLLLSARLQEKITMEGTREGNTETVPKRQKMVRQTVTVKDKTKTKGSVSERKKDKSQADSCWQLRRDIGETSCHWQRYVRVLLMLYLFSLCWHRHEKAQRSPTRGRETSQVSLWCRNAFLYSVFFFKMTVMFKSGWKKQNKNMNFFSPVKSDSSWFFFFLFFSSFPVVTN